MTEILKMLVLTKDDELLRRIRKIVLSLKTTVDGVKKINDVRAKIFRNMIDVLIVSSDSYKKDEVDQFMDELGMIMSKSPTTQVLLLMNPEDFETGLQSLMDLDFYQYAKLPVSDTELTLLLETAIERIPLVRMKPPEELNANSDRLGKLVGTSAKMQKIYRQLHQAAGTEVNILLLGETGTGKDLAAQTIHQLSDRSDEPFVPINLGAIPPDLVASELFGHTKGAFTGAVKETRGIFEKAEKGMVFLDEIEAIDERIQISLLRLIEQRKFQKLGGKEDVLNRARLIASSNENLQELIANGTFRKDLYYRLDVFHITMPPLRENPEDIPLLVNEFLSKDNRKYNSNIKGISSECLRSFKKFDWPGNVRELKNVIQRAAIVCEGDEIQMEHLPPRFRNVTDKKSDTTVTFEVGTPLAKVEKEMILKALSVSNNNRTKAAELLGISRRAIYNKLKKHNIK
ncbi:MAG: sigma-54 dependent transcriptional regulator [candidate division KSB1 bacterium]|nr:sigma-54 dependent transcriptional regulator [candidate division KSB1 bacterium]